MCIINNPTNAGHYELVPSVPGSPNPSGGKWERTPTLPDEGDFTHQGYYYGGGAYASSSTYTTASAGGDIVFKYEWHPDNAHDAPPQKVVVREECTARGGGISIGVAPIKPVAQADNGLGDPATVDEHHDPQGGWYYSKISEGSHTRIQDGGALLTFTCKARTKAEVTAPPSGDALSEASVVYSVRVAPIQVSLSGGIDGYDYLIGQRAIASVTNGGLMPLSHLWTVSGGDPFKDYYADFDVSDFPPLGALDTQSIQFYWKKPEKSVTVSCTVELALPDNTTETVTVNKECKVEKPFNTVTADMGTVELYSSINPDRLVLTGLTLTNHNGTRSTGMIWTGSVTTPSQFLSQNDADAGGWNYTQTVVPHRARKDTNNVFHYFSLNGVDCVLDTSFGYDPIFPTLYTPDGTDWKEGDEPSMGVAGNKYIEILDSFKTYTLYLPPGSTERQDIWYASSDRKFVPLKYIEWYMEGEATLNAASGEWQKSNAGAAWSYGADFPPHPIWSGNVKKGTMP